MMSEGEERKTDKRSMGKTLPISVTITYDITKNLENQMDVISCIDF